MYDPTFDTCGYMQRHGPGSAAWENRARVSEQTALSPSPSSSSTTAASSAPLGPAVREVNAWLSTRQNRLPVSASSSAASSSSSSFSSLFLDNIATALSSRLQTRDVQHTLTDDQTQRWYTALQTKTSTIASLNQDYHRRGAEQARNLKRVDDEVKDQVHTIDVQFQQMTAAYHSDCERVQRAKAQLLSLQQEAHRDNALLANRELETLAQKEREAVDEFRAICFSLGVNEWGSVISAAEGDAQTTTHPLGDEGEGEAATQDQEATSDELGRLFEGPSSPLSNFVSNIHEEPSNPSPPLSGSSSNDVGPALASATPNVPHAPHAPHVPHTPHTLHVSPATKKEWSKWDKADLVPFQCPITRNVMHDPVICPEGHTFERSAIERWIGSNRSNPLTRSRLRCRHLVPNISLRDTIKRQNIIEIEKFLEQESEQESE